MSGKPDLASRAEAGNIDAQFEFARHHETNGRHDLARGWYARAAKAGHLVALRSLAINLMTHNPIVASDATGMIRTAAERGDADAAHICAVIAAQDDSLRDNWSVALDYLVQAAKLGSSVALGELEVLARSNESTRTAAPLPSEPSEMRRMIDLGPWLRPVDSRVTFDDPHIRIAENFVPGHWCDWLVERARPMLAKAEVYNLQTGKGSREEGSRNNSAATFDLARSNVILTLMRARIAALRGISPSEFEPTSVLHYVPGQQFGPHFDFIMPDIPSLAREIARVGQRFATFLAYLNDDYDSGETEFCELKWSFKGKKGDGLLFWNVDAEGKPNPKTLHAGLSPTRGEKWVLSQWIRRRDGTARLPQ